MLTVTSVTTVHSVGWPEQRVVGGESGRWVCWSSPSKSLEMFPSENNLFPIFERGGCAEGSHCDFAADYAELSGVTEDERTSNSGENGNFTRLLYDGRFRLGG